MSFIIKIFLLVISSISILGFSIFLIIYIVRILKEELKYKKAKKKKVYGSPADRAEDEIYDMFKDIIIYQGGYVYKRVMMNDELNHTSEVDVLYISEYGIYFVEVKYWYGKVTGNPYDHYWKHTYQGITKKELNPIIANERHIMFAKRVVDTKMPAKSIIVFASNANISKIKSTIVIRKEKLFEFVTKQDRKVLSKEEVEIYNEHFLLFVDFPSKTHEEHVRDVIEIYSKGEW